MLYNKKSNFISIKDVIIPFFLNVISLLVVAFSNIRLFNWKMDVLFKIGLPLIIGSYILEMLFYVPVLIFLQMIRTKSCLKNVLIRVITSILWAFTPNALIWFLLSIINLTLCQLPWYYFSLTYILSKFLLIPLSLFYFYWRFFEENIYDSIIDTMLTSIVVLILTTIHF
jgi:hypothetical protein